MMKAILFALFVCLLMVGCGTPSPQYVSKIREQARKEQLEREAMNPKKDTIETAIESAVDWFTLRSRDGITYLPNTDKPFSGWAKQTYGNGQVKVMAEFTDGSVTRFKQWQENDIPQLEYGYSKGKVSQSDVPLVMALWLNKNKFPFGHGLATLWYENGQKKTEVNWEDGKQDGLHTSWYENGQKMWENNFKDDKRDGLQDWWYENGQKRWEENYKEGENDGIQTRWYENGQKEKEENYKDGENDGIQTRWYENGQKRWEENYKDGENDGIQTRWYENGQKRWENNFKDGKQDGLQDWWYENGQKRNELNYKDGKLISAKVWKPNGEKCPVTNVKEGDGIWVSYNWDGTENSRETYKDGEVDLPKKYVKEFGGLEKWLPGAILVDPQEKSVDEVINGIDFLLDDIMQHSIKESVEDEEKTEIEAAVDWSELQDRDGVFYLFDTNKTFNGYARRSYENGMKYSEMYYINGQKKKEKHFGDGKPDRLWTEWYKNGQKRNELNYKDGKLMSAVAWKPNGEKCPETNVKDGNGVVVSYNGDGQKDTEENFKDGKQDGLETKWYKNGHKREEKNYKDGKMDGLWINYNEEGQKNWEINFKDGELVED